MVQLQVLVVISLRLAKYTTTAAAILLAAALAGCSDRSSSSNHERRLLTPSPSYSGSVPSFSGPWAADFEEAYRATTSELVHQILSKESITDRDYAEVSDGYVKCMKSKGFTAEITGPAGEGSVEGGDNANEAHMACSDDMAVISALRHSVMRNPQNHDENTIVVACLIRNEIAPPSYTPAEYGKDWEAWSFPFETEAHGFESCASDPLDLGWQ